MKKDIENRDDVILLVNSFYETVRENRILGYIFNDIAKVDWGKHLPKMYSFWGSLLLGEHSYSGNPMGKHIELSRITSMTEIEFSEWLSLFKQTVDNLFAGEIAEDAKFRAGHIAQMMLHKIQPI